MNWPRLTLVIGKGGSGKSAVAAALAMGLARSRPTLLAGLDRRGSAARLLDVSLNADQTATIADGLTAALLHGRHELERFIRRLVPIQTISDRLVSSRSFGYVAAALPGLESFVLLHRFSSLAWEAARDDHYVVVDGLSTGNSLELLSIAFGMRNLASTGTLIRLAIDLEGFIADSERFGVAVVMRPQTLAVREALEAVDVLRERLHVANVTAVLNAVPPSLFRPQELEALTRIDPAHLRLVTQRLELDQALDRARRKLRTAKLPAVELPMLFSSAFTREQVNDLSFALCPQVAE